MPDMYATIRRRSVPTRPTKARFWFKVRGEPRHVDLVVEPGVTPMFVARWVLALLDEPRRDVTLIRGSYLPHGA